MAAWRSIVRMRAGFAVMVLLSGALLPLALAAPASAGWTAQSSTTANNLRGVFCATASQCWATGWDGTILATADSGSTWIAQNSGIAVLSLRGQSCPTSLKCWIVGDSGKILTTSDGGSTWSAQTSGTTNILWDVSCPTVSNCWAVGASGTIIATTNSGATWTSQAAFGITSELTEVACNSTSQCWAVGASGTILATTNGTTWAVQTSGTTNYLDGLSCPSASQCLAVGNFGTILATANGGVTWTAQSSGTTNHLKGLSCASASVCRAVGLTGMVLQTTNGGLSWSSQTSGTTSHLFAIACPTVSRCWAAGDSGTIVAFGPPGAPTITSTPPDPSTSNDATFAFVGEPGAGFECKLDAGLFATCTSPKSYAGLGGGVHTFQVRQIDEVGSVSPAASFAWTIDLPQCGDGVDNDGDTKVDFPSDPGCTDAADDSEGATCDPLAEGVVACLDPSTLVTRVTILQPEVVPGPAHHVAGHVDIYRFVLPGGIVATLPCVVLGADGITANPCADAGGTFFARLQTLVDDTVDEPQLVDGPVLATVGVCNAELTVTASGIGIQSAPALVPC